MKILFICRGNVGRSQIAEVLFNKLVGGNHTSTSAGTKVFNKDGESRDGVMLKDTQGAENVIEAMSLIDFDLKDNKRTQLTPQLLEECDKAIVMAEPETFPDYLKESDKVTYWEVEDPKGMSVEDTSVLRDKIEVRIKTLLEELR